MSICHQIDSHKLLCLTSTFVRDQIVRDQFIREPICPGTKKFDGFTLLKLTVYSIFFGFSQKRL